MAGDGPSFLEYFIAAAVLGTAVGNMFVVRRLRSISKLKAPGDPWEKVKADNTSKGEQNVQQEMYNNLKKFQSSQNEIIMKKKVLKQWYITNFDSRHRPSVSYLPEYYSKHLVVLNLPLNQYPSKSEIKEAYRKYAIAHHPDRNNVHKEVNNVKFRDGNEKYKELLLYIEGQEKEMSLGE